MDTIETLSKNLLLLANNPAAMQTLLLNQLQKAQDSANNITLMDPTDPVVFLTECGVTLAHATIEGVRATIPRTYPSMAQTMDDLYRHMSDIDYIDVFAQPASTELQLIIDIDSLLAKAMPLQFAGVRKVVIPRDTQFKVAGYVFSIQYPIEIRVLPYGTSDNPAFQVLWITENQSPISPVSTNSLEWELGSSPTTTSTLLRIKIPVKQYDVKSHSDTTTGTNTFVMQRTFTNKFFYVRVWQHTANGTGWVEIPHTHSRDVYDPTVGTALIQVNNGAIQCTIPSVYLNSGLVSGEIRMDVYTTLGPLDIDLSSYAMDEFTWNLRDLNDEVDASYWNPLKSFSISQVIAESGYRTNGGRIDLTFEELRERVVNNAVGVRQTPITPGQLSTVVSDYGLELYNAIDYVTDRTYLLSAPLPDSTLTKVSSPIGSVTSPLYFSWDELAVLPTVRINDSRMTVLPGTLYKFDGASLAVDATMTELVRSMRKADLVTAGNATAYLFTPFHYVLDINNNAIDVRIYQLDKPKLSSKRFITTNITTELSVVTADYQILMTETGYVLRTVTKSEPPYQALSDDQVFAQISFTPRNGENVAYINGTLVGKQGSERVWEFPLETNLDVDRNDELVLTNTRITSSNTVDVPVALLQDFNVFYGCSAYYPKNYERVDMDTIIMAPSRDAIGITHEIFKIELGKSLSAFWRKARAVTDSINYEYYTEDELATWEEDVLDRDANGVPKYTIDDTQNPPVQLVYLHRAGDPKYKEDGTREIAHYKGDLKRDPSTKEPIIAKPRSIRFRSEMAVLDARYKFANSDEAQSYLQTVIDFLIVKITDSVPSLQSQLLERTEAFFVPITTMGYINARTEDGAVTPIPAENQFTVNYYLTAANRQNTDLIAMIRKQTSQVINEYLETHNTVSATELGKVLGTKLGGSIIGVELGDMGPDQDMRLFTVVDEAARVTIGKKLAIEANGSIGLKDDIVIAYNRHDTDKN